MVDRILALVVTLALVASCGSESSDGGPSYRQSPSGPPIEAINDEPPYGVGVEVGRTYRYVLYVHCGVRWARIDGEYWETATLGDGANPPRGWGNPLDDGTLVLLDGDSAEYTGGPDVTIEFERDNGTDGPGPCR